VKISQDKNGSRRVVAVSGSLTVADSSDLKKVMAENLRKGHQLELVLDEVSEVDISVIQIMAAAVKAAEAGDRKFSVKTPVPEPVAESLRLSGFLNHYNCKETDCVWCAISSQVQGA
jgi:anti-anti-sigma regulatory factor